MYFWEPFFTKKAHFKTMESNAKKTMSTVQANELRNIARRVTRSNDIYSILLNASALRDDTSKLNKVDFFATCSNGSIDTIQH